MLPIASVRRGASCDGASPAEEQGWLSRALSIEYRMVSALRFLLDCTSRAPGPPFDTDRSLDKVLLESC